MLSISISPDATEDVQQIQEYVATHSHSWASRVSTKIMQSVDLLAQHPNLGHKRSDLTDRDVLFWQVYRYSIIYSHSKTELRIHRVISNYRNLTKILQ